MRQTCRACAASFSKSSWRPRSFSPANIPLLRSPPRCEQSNETSKSMPFAGYYEDALDAPLHTISPLTRTAPAPPPPDDPPKTEKEKTMERARIVFGSRLAGPAERRDEIKKLSTNIAGVMVPPKPEEPDNCCMSGCVNCVWDRYRDEIEEWAEASALARARVAEQRQKDTPPHATVSMDDDGGGSEASWESAQLGQEGGDIFAGIPVGIREFMKTEKRLKEMRKRVGVPAVND